MSSQTGKLKMFSYCPTRLEAEVEFPLEWTIVIGVSAVVAEKTGAAQARYNNVSLLARNGAAAYGTARGVAFNNWADVIADQRSHGCKDPIEDVRLVLKEGKHKDLGKHDTLPSIAREDESCI